MTRYLFIIAILWQIIGCDTFSYIPLPDLRELPDQTSTTATGPVSIPAPPQSAMITQIISDSSNTCASMQTTVTSPTIEFRSLPSYLAKDNDETCSSKYNLPFENLSTLKINEHKFLKIEMEYKSKLYFNSKYDINAMQLEIGVYIDSIDIGIANDKTYHKLDSIAGYDILTQSNDLKFSKLYDISSINSQNLSKLYIEIRSYYRNKNIEINSNNETNNFKRILKENSRLKINSVQFIN